MRRIVAIALMVASARAYAGPELGQSDKGRQVFAGERAVLIAVDAKAEAASWDTSFHDAEVAEAREEHEEELGAGIFAAGLAATALGFARAAHRESGGVALGVGGWVAMDVGALVYAMAHPAGERRSHHRSGR